MNGRASIIRMDMKYNTPLFAQALRNTCVHTILCVRIVVFNIYINNRVPFFSLLMYLPWY